MQGRRLPDGPMADHFEPGDYQLSESGKTLYCRLPHSPAGREAFAALPVNVPDSERAWTCTIEADGTITISPSIHDTDAGGYHGFLQHGVWTDG